MKAVLIGLDHPESAVVQAELSARGIPALAARTPAEGAARFDPADGSARLFVVTVRTPADRAGVRQLRTAFPTTPLIALVELAGDPAALLAVNRDGADQVVGLPLNRPDLGAAIGQVVLRVRPAGQAPGLVVVTGAISGCGCSTVAANLAAELAHDHEVDTVLVEAALQMGTQAAHLRVRPTVTLTDLIDEPAGPTADRLRAALTPITPGLQLLAASPHPARSEPPGAAGKVLTALRMCQELAGAVVADVPCLYDDLHFEALWAADQVVLVADQSIPAVRTTRMILDAVGRAKTVHVVLNRYDPTIPTLSAHKITETLGGLGVRTIPNDYAGVTRAAAEGRLLRGLAPHAPVTAAIGDLASAIVGRPAARSAEEMNAFVRALVSLKGWGRT